MLTSQLQAALIFEEDFSSGFNTGNIHNQGDWEVSGGSTTQHQIVSGGLSYSDGDVNHQGGNLNAMTAGGTEQYASAGFASQTGDIYLSALIQRNSGGFFMVGLTGLDGANMPGSAGSVAGAGFRISNTEALARVFSDLSSGPTRVEVGNFAHNNETVLMVGKLFKSDPNGNYDSFSYTVNPTSLNEPTNWLATAVAVDETNGIGLDFIDTVWFRAGGGGGHDYETDMIRVGTTYSAVVIPEPTTALLGGLGLLALLRRRRP